MFPLDLIVHIAMCVRATAYAFIKATGCGDDDISNNNKCHGINAQRRAADRQERQRAKNYTKQSHR